jgi:hypothetical protein
MELSQFIFFHFTAFLNFLALPGSEYYSSANCRYLGLIPDEDISTPGEEKNSEKSPKWKKYF